MSPQPVRSTRELANQRHPREQAVLGVVQVLFDVVAEVEVVSHLV